MEELIERLTRCGLTRRQAESLSKAFKTLGDFAQYVRIVEEENRKTGRGDRSDDPDDE